MKLSEVLPVTSRCHQFLLFKGAGKGANIVKAYLQGDIVQNIVCFLQKGFCLIDAEAFQII